MSDPAGTAARADSVPEEHLPALLAWQFRRDQMRDPKRPPRERAALLWADLARYLLAPDPHHALWLPERNTPRKLARDFPRESRPLDTDQRLEFTADYELTAG